MFDRSGRVSSLNSEETFGKSKRLGGFPKKGNIYSSRAAAAAAAARLEEKRATQNSPRHRHNYIGSGRNISSGSR